MNIYKYKNKTKAYDFNGGHFTQDTNYIFVEST